MNIPETPAIPTTRATLGLATTDSPTLANLTLSGGTLTGGATGLTLAAGGTNQPVNITPTGTGNVVLGYTGGSSTRFMSSARAFIFSIYPDENLVTEKISFYGPGGLTYHSADWRLIWTNSSTVNGVIDTGLSRLAAGSLGLGTGAAGNASGSLSLLNLTATGTINVGTTSSVTGIRTAVATLDFANILAAGSEDKTITVTGAAVGMAVIMGLPATIGAGIVFNAWVSATDTVTIRANNAGAIAVDLASASYRVTVVSF